MPVQALIVDFSIFDMIEAMVFRQTLFGDLFYVRFFLHPIDLPAERFS